jgi:hypothetical protein
MTAPLKRPEIEEMEMLEFVVTLALCAAFAGPLAALSLARA